jgi:hypothetical protein
LARREHPVAAECAPGLRGQQGRRALAPEFLWRQSGAGFRIAAVVVIEYLDLVDYLAIAAEVTGLGATTIAQ